MGGDALCLAYQAGTGSHCMRCDSEAWRRDDGKDLLTKIDGSFPLSERKKKKKMMMMMMFTGCLFEKELVTQFVIVKNGPLLQLAMLLCRVKHARDHCRSSW